MKIIDFFIGLTLMNAMPHFVLGIWKGRMMSAFGINNMGNIVYGLLNFAISITLYIVSYGLDALLENGIYFGAATVLLVYILTGQFWYKLFLKEKA